MLKENYGKPWEPATTLCGTLDWKDGDEKTYCCFNTTARDLARLGRLILNKGNWNGRQLISETYLNEAITPAGYLENEFGDGCTWIIMVFKSGLCITKRCGFLRFRGLGGQ